MIETALLFVERVLGFLWSRWRPTQVRVAASHHDLYETSSITLAIAPVAVQWGNAQHDDYYTLQRQGESAFVVPTIIVATVSNDEPKPVYVREVILRVLDYVPESGALIDKAGLVLRAIQAGGRGADGSFGVTFDSTHASTYRLLRSARSDGYDGPLRMRIDPGGFAELVVQPWPTRPGRYRLRVAVELTLGRKTWTKVLEPDIYVFQLSESGGHGLVATETREFQSSRTIDGRAFLAAKQEKLELVPAPAGLPDDRQLVVIARMEAVAL